MVNGGDESDDSVDTTCVVFPNQAIGSNGLCQDTRPGYHSTKYSLNNFSFLVT
jgi:hypothetical protein